MYIRKASRSYKGKTYSNYLLVESVVTAKGPRQKAICSLGDLSPRPRQQWLELARKLESALTGQRDLLVPSLPKTDPELEGLIAKAQSGRQGQKRSRSEKVPTTAASEAGTDLVAVHTERIETECIREAGPVHVGYQF